MDLADFIHEGSQATAFCDDCGESGEAKGKEDIIALSRRMSTHTHEARHVAGIEIVTDPEDEDDSLVMNLKFTPRDE